ncbi:MULTISPECIES: CCRG-2 family RiPP [Prochlorococcus]|uniref:CCRG-2 family RiPP n=1 Tax=Prochlorococcus TaxID=1218 RepID=UPI0007B39A18|nr:MULTISPECIES: CCRG-2 family RiPP [Prochlorococcus]KZR62592.1 hypothetical protein PMIT1312_02058 [Prochlorococcus marinus str. MIT 1312]KZR80926.1 hypothetical protein PMIT1327_01374 [Prochlorococcus marinus str. MIT 1327]NMO84150.1 CCRG-2 family RiPP [Prochlorococcus sp. P1344]NMP05560.1 CCRG-2 family RiPP [Prochlorococcus sp. P1361]NMP12510.1 CCRG-2 family RiPP [Prochlorococcus sp.P1363]
MTEPNNTNEEINEELSTDELKSVSGGLMGQHQGAVNSFTDKVKSGAQSYTQQDDNETSSDYNKRVGLDTGPIDNSEVGPIGRER